MLQLDLFGAEVSAVVARIPRRGVSGSDLLVFLRPDSRTNLIVLV